MNFFVSWIVYRRDYSELFSSFSQFLASLGLGQHYSSTSFCLYRECNKSIINALFKLRLPQLESESIACLGLRPIGIVTFVATCLSFHALVECLVLLPVADALEVGLVSFLVIFVVVD